MPLTGPEIRDLAHYRSMQMADDHIRMETLAHIYRGRHKHLFPAEFREGEVVKIAGFIRRAWRSFARMTGKVPDIRVAPISLSSRNQDAADRVEKICFSYNRTWDMQRKMNILAHYLVGMGAVGTGIIPDPRAQSPILLVEDPRNCFPGPTYESTSVVSQTPLWHQSWADLGGTLADMLVRKTINGRQLRARFPGSDYATKHAADPNEPHTLYQYYDDTYWTTVAYASGEILAQAPHGLSWCPWSFPTVFTPDSPAGSSDFEQQIGLEIAFMRLLDQKLSLNDAVVYPWVVEKGYVEAFPAQRRMVLGSADSAVSYLSPPATFQVDRDAAMVRDLLRLFNNETEASQGEISGGPITGRGIIELSKPVIEAVQSFFDDLSFYLPKLYTSALLMDREMFGNVTKTLSGRQRGETFLSSYTPSKDITDFGTLSVEFGPGIGDFDSHLRLLQSLGAEVISNTTVMEKNPHIRSVSEEKRRVIIEKAEKLLYEQAFLGQAAVPANWLAQFIDAVSGGKDPTKWIIDNPVQQATLTPDQVTPVEPGALPPGAAPGGELIQPPPLEALLGVS